ncbi:hypothetical protein PUNSTDRAFT_119820 [Punctularia strigosozonata HHB-11173 SS5]|uniref:uncharacterized protein n=1 Tax=Punctularia strigosozonata (strain HHB-11173) TaxID=741275 RepID=UPI0004418726|nr:uncharacterized protein PUNSTDRAFT_119820 [Punctularia strigosozonata HHB-11173 SS5]EIN10998.1 hypothetical protein PUNSTDRAFT_119820 [Punctularia strigosozonata HHB-11173 SS5]
MIPLVPTLALAMLSFICSAFVILRIVISILPPGPFSRHVPPSEFGLPNFRSLTPADKSHIWLATCDLAALVLFVWQAIDETTGGPQDFAAATDAGSAARLWLAITLRPTCLLVVSALTLLHVRLGRPVSFGWKHWILWAPLIIMVATGAGVATTLAAIDKSSLFVGLAAYSTAVAVLSSACFVSLIATLVMIKRNLTRSDGPTDQWPPMRQVEEKPRPSFATEDVDGLRDGSSWITSNASSRRDSISAFSFSTHHSVRPPTPTSMRIKRAMAASQPSVAPKSSFWFGPATPGTAPSGAREASVPPVPPLPSPYGPTPISPTGMAINDDVDPFRREETPIPPEHHHHQRLRMGSQTSWLTSNSGNSEATLSAWSFPTTHATHAGANEYAAVRPNTPVPSTPYATELPPTSTAVSRPITPALSSAQVLGGYGYAPEAARAEKGVGSIATVPSGDLDVSVYRTVGWLVTIWVPLALALPYFFAVSPHGVTPSVASILLVLSSTLSSPILAFNILFRSPIPIPSGLFESYSEPPSIVNRAPSPGGLERLSREYKRSGSVTVVEGKRSTDVWLVNGDAKDGQGKVGRAMGMLQPKPKLSVMPIQDEEEPVTPPLPIQYEDTPAPTVPPTPASATSAEMGRIRKESKASSYYSGADASIQHAARVMVAQKHYSALAKTFVLPPSPEQRASMAAAAAVTSAASGVRLINTTGHLRSRSTSSVNSAQMPLSAPPNLPLPPTPPSVKNARLAKMRKTHKRSQSSVSLPTVPGANDSGFSFGAVDDVNQIDALSAKVLPILVPGLKVGEGMKITPDWNRPRAGTLARHGRVSDAPTSPGNGDWSSIGEFSSPEVHSTPLKNGRGLRTKKVSGHKRHHFSMPSLSLGKDAFHISNWEIEQDVNVATEEGKRHDALAMPHLLDVVKEEDERRPVSLDVPAGVDTARSSLLTLLEKAIAPVPPSASSEVTLFDWDAATGPQAESTPHDHKARARKVAQEAVPPLPTASTRRSSIVYVRSDDQPAVGTERPQSKRSSIVYVKSGDENAPPAEGANVQRSTSGRFAQWGARAVRPLKPKANKGKVSPPPSGQSSSPTGLRPLSLLQERNANVSTESAHGVRPLTLGRKKKLQEGMDPVAENAALAEVGNTNAGLKPLKLARSETAKKRGLLMNHAGVPDVVVRPPSASEHVGFGYSFR